MRSGITRSMWRRGAFYAMRMRIVSPPPAPEIWAPIAMNHQAVVGGRRLRLRAAFSMTVLAVAT